MPKPATSRTSRFALRLPLPCRGPGSDEIPCAPATPRQRELATRLADLGDRLAARQGISRRAFFATAAGLAAAFVALNQTFGPLFEASEAEAAEPERAVARAAALSGQFIMDMHTHFLRPDTRLEGFVAMREQTVAAGWNPQLTGPQTIDDLKFQSYLEEMYLLSDTSMACISGAPSEIPEDWFLPNPMIAEARNSINAVAGSRRALAHAIFAPGYPGWLDQVDQAIAELKPDAFKGYTIGDNTHKELSKHPWRMDDEKLVYPAYERFQKAGLTNVCVHKGLFPPQTAARFPDLLDYCDVRDVAKAAKDWPELNFIIYHAGYRFAGGGTAEQAWRQFQETGRIEWVTDLAEIPTKHGVSNVYADIGQTFATTCIAEPRLAAVILGQLIKGLGADHVCWGTDAIWTGGPQWQIEALRRLEIPEDLRTQHGFEPLGPADGPVKAAIFGDNNARLYAITPPERAAVAGDELALRRRARVAGA